jgi:hypothetical protein
MDERRFVVWDADGRPLGAFPDFDTAPRSAHLRLWQRRTPVPLTLDDRVAKVSRRISRARCELVAWAEFAVLPGCDLPTSAWSVPTCRSTSPRTTRARERSPAPVRGQAYGPPCEAQHDR